MLGGRARLGLIALFYLKLNGYKGLREICYRRELVKAVELGMADLFR